MDIKTLLQSVDIVKFLSQYVDLTEKGGEWWGISPFTFPPEKTPSFSVRREANNFYDFSSGIGGNAITFLKHYFNLTGREAVEKLMEYAGVDGKMDEAPQKMAATLVCRQYLPQQRTEKQSKAEILPDDVMLRYEKDEEKLAVWEKEGISRATLDKFGVFYDRFADRLVYPVRNREGKIVNIGGRTLDPAWKEKKLRKYTYYNPWNGGMNVVYGLFENREAIRQAREVIVFEGAKSVMLADTWGIRNTAALLTSHLSPNQLKLLAALCCRVVFALDKEIDPAQDHNIQKLRRYVTVQYIRDTNDMLSEKEAPVDRGEEVFRKLYADRMDH